MFVFACKYLGELSRTTGLTLSYAVLKVHPRTTSGPVLFAEPVSRRFSFVVIRFCKAFLVMIIGLFTLLVAFNNVVDYDTNFFYVKHVLSMDTTFAANLLIGRAIVDARIHHVAYGFIILLEFVIAALCIGGAIQLFVAIRKPHAQFTKAKNIAILGLVLGVALFFVGFVTIGGEWFLMWQSQKWNGLAAATRLITCFGISLIFLNQQD